MIDDCVGTIASSGLHGVEGLNRACGKSRRTSCSCSRRFNHADSNMIDDCVGIIASSSMHGVEGLNGT